MSDSALIVGTFFTPGSSNSEGGIAVNNVQEIIIEPVNEFALVSERSLASIWDKPEEDEAWKDL
jgi:hypothetical protein